MGETYNMDNLVGKQFFARTKVGVKKLPLDKEPIFRTFEAGQNIGIVYSWLNEKLPDRTEKYWQIENPQGGYFYLAVKTGTINTDMLDLQGVKSEEEIKQENDKANMSIWERAQGFVFSAIGLIGAIIILKSYKK
jgi:hypothetical protein